MKQVNYIYVKIMGRQGKYTGQNEFKRKKYNVIADNNTYFVVDNFSFTSVKHEKSDYSESLGDFKICHHNYCSFFGSYITLTIYTLKNIRTTTIKNKIKKYIKEKLSDFSNVDLSFLDNLEQIGEKNENR